MFRHGDWVRPIVGLYKGDIALVWDRKLQGARLPSAVEPDEICVLVVPRIRLPRPRPTKAIEKRHPARRVTRRMRQLAKAYNDDCYDGLMFFNSLLVTSFQTKRVIRCTPRYEELQDYSEAGLNVRAWRRFIAQSTLRRGERVLVRGWAEHDMVATFCSSIGAEATVASTDDDTREMYVSIHQLEREFRVGDVVQRIPTVAGESIRVGNVVKVVDMDKESEVKKKRNKRILDEEQDIASQGRYYKRLINEYGGATHGPRKEGDGDRAKAEQFLPHNLYASQMPRLIEVTVLEKDTLTEVSQCIYPSPMFLHLLASKFTCGHLELEFHSEEFAMAKPCMLSQAKQRYIQDPHLHNEVVVYGGEYKGCHGVYKDGNEAKVKVQLEAKITASEVWIAHEYVWDK